MLKVWTVFSKMGIIFSRFRKKSTIELLENVEEEIKELKACSADTELRHKTITKRLLMYSSGLCALFAIMLYFYIPPKLETKIILTSLLLFSPVIYYVIYKLISWHYNRKIKSSHLRLKDLMKKKKNLLDEIMEKETYKVAKEVLEKFAPESLPQKQSLEFNSGMIPSRSSAVTLPNNKFVRPMGNVKQMQQIQRVNTVLPQNLNFTGTRAAPNLNQVLPPLEGSKNVQNPVTSFSKTYSERILEFLLGDGPNNRYALICKNCSTHNGLALSEEFEYTAFRCYACHTLNSARKQRPTAPKLDSDRPALDFEPSDPSSYSSSTSGDENNYKIEELEDEVQKKEQEVKEIEEEKEERIVELTNCSCGTLDDSQSSDTNDLKLREVGDASSILKDHSAFSMRTYDVKLSNESIEEDKLGTNQYTSRESVVDKSNNQSSLDQINKELNPDSVLNGVSDLQSSK